MTKLLYFLALFAPCLALGWAFLPTDRPRLVDGEFLVDMERVESKDGTHRMALRYKTQAPGAKTDDGVPYAKTYTSHSVVIESKAGLGWRTLKTVPLTGVHKISPDAWVQQIHSIDMASETAKLKIGQRIKRNGWTTAKFQWCVVDVNTGEITKTIQDAGWADTLKNVGPNYWKNPNHVR